MTSSKPTRPPRAGPLGAGTVVPRPRAERPTPAGTGLVPRQQRVPAGPELPSGRAAEGAARPDGEETPGVRDGNVASCAPGSQPRICGLDLSLTSTGIARIGEEAELWRITPKRATGCDRLNQILREITSRTDGAGLVVIEGPSYGSTGGKEHERGGLWWLVRYHLWQASQNVAVVPPAVLKKYATGYGNAGKDTVLAAVIRRYPDVMVDGNDVADALVLAAMGADHLGYPLAVVPQIQRAALTKVDWPPFADLRSPP